MSLFNTRPRTVEEAVAPLRPMMADLAEISETATRHIDRNTEAMDTLAVENLALTGEKVRAASLIKSLGDLFGD